MLCKGVSLESVAELDRIHYLVLGSGRKGCLYFRVLLKALQAQTAPTDQVQYEWTGKEMKIITNFTATQQVKRNGHSE